MSADVRRFRGHIACKLAPAFFSRHASDRVNVPPQKLFDYLDGKLPAPEREELEQKMGNDSNLLRQLAIARKLREAMPGSQEVIGSVDDVSAADRRGAILSRRVALAFIVLVFLNVCIGLWFIFQSEKKTAKSRDTDVRQQVEQSLAHAAVSAMPTPNIEADEIKITTPVEQQEQTVQKVISAATEAGGVGAKALSDESGIVVLIDLPKSRELDFRNKLVALGGPSPPPVEESRSPNDRKFLQVRVVKATQ